MNDPKVPSNDPSMDDILASIRKIISDEEARAQGGGSPAAEARPESPTSPDPSTEQQDVLLLTDLIEDGQPAVPMSPQPRPAPSTTFHQPLTPPSQLRPAAPEQPGGHALAEAAAADVAISTLHQLNKTVLD